MADSRSYADRHAKAAETFAVFAPDVAPERVAKSFSNRQGALGSFAFDVVGGMWARPQLNRRDRSLLVISAWPPRRATRSSSPTPASGFATA
jgi:hypothetical protein